ncbi:protein NYNRIN-like [Rhinoderma darwinii]|uniref:protein NYNRIN-like n=1 Tax=Rhinoderma darwinii TaxID=43563 RepID=UPI003F6664B7
MLWQTKPQKQAAQKLPVLAAVCQIKDPEETRPAVSPELLQKLQGQATEEEKDKWTAQGATLRKDGLWQCQNKLCLPKTMFPMMAQITHGETHQSKTAMMDLVNKVWYAPGFSVMASSFTQGCMICATHNIGRTVKVPQKHTPRPIYPFQRLQIDYIQLPKVGTYEYVLVCIDLFSGWPEAFPVTKATAVATAKKLINEVVCRYGVPEVNKSDRGTHFTGEIMNYVLSALGISQALHTPYHPQSSGKVERLNGTLKLKIQKAMVETGKPWTECLPLALFSVRYTPTKRTGLSPYEILFGSAPRLGCYFP